MIIVQLSGGIGNQMFQYALYASLSEMGKDVRLDISKLEKLKPHNGYVLEYVFGVKPTRAKEEDVKKLATPSHGMIGRVRNKLKLYKTTHFIYSWLDYTTEVYSLEGNIYLQGFWQSEKYFSNIFDQIKNTFTFKDAVLNIRSKEFAEIIKSKNSVSIHVRRGDYLNGSLYKGICTKEYYEKAIEKIDSMIDEVSFFWFSDDINWCKSNFNDDRFYFVDWNSSKDESYNDMFLMSCCRNHIIANSSFSWWGAWLSKDERKIVISPSRWINNKKYNINDILPTNWICIT